MAIPGITPEIADSIISFREHDEIKNTGDAGIPPESIRYITFGDSYTYTIDSAGLKGNVKTVSASGQRLKLREVITTGTFIIKVLHTEKNDRYNRS